MTTNQKGAIAEAAIACEAIKLGIGVLKPIGDMRYDFVFDTGDRLIRVQRKWGRRLGDVIIGAFYANRRAREGLRRSYYDAKEVDAFAIYCADLDRCFFVPISDLDGCKQVQLRLEPTRNNQASGIRWAREYEFVAKLGAALGP
ncbi:MAG TPA: group I intron-associated PD-(D/E)XK endonuclease [Gaiellaceae bacterium]